MGRADGMRDVDVEGCVAVSVGGVFTFGTAGWVPEVCPVGVVFGKGKRES